MHAVLYTHQLEPITVVDIPMFLWERLANGEAIVLPVEPEMNLKPHTGEPTGPVLFRLVVIFGERLLRRGHEALMLFTADEENALKLRAGFLPGQRRELRDREHGAFAAGFLKALQEFGG